jgi:hypothetical protein
MAVGVGILEDTQLKGWKSLDFVIKWTNAYVSFTLTSTRLGAPQQKLDTGSWESVTASRWSLTLPSIGGAPAAVPSSACSLHSGGIRFGTPTVLRLFALFVGL